MEGQRNDKNNNRKVAERYRNKYKREGEKKLVKNIRNTRIPKHNCYK